MIVNTPLDISALSLSVISLSLIILKHPSSLTSKHFSRYNAHDKLLLQLIAGAICMQSLNIVNSSINLAGVYLNSSISIGVTFKEQWVMSPFIVSIYCLFMFQTWTTNRLPIFKYFQIFKVGGDLTRQERLLLKYARLVLPIITLLNTLPFILANVLYFDIHYPYLRFFCSIAWTLLSVPPAIYADKKVVSLVFQHFSAASNVGDSGGDGRTPATAADAFHLNVLSTDAAESNPVSNLECALPTSVNPVSILSTSVDVKDSSKNADAAAALIQAVKARDIKNHKIKTVEKRLKLLMTLTQVFGVFLLFGMVLSEFVFRLSMSGIYGIICGMAGFTHLNVALYSEILLDSLNEIKAIQSKGLKSLMISKGGFKSERGITSSGATPSEVGVASGPFVGEVRAFRHPRERVDDFSSISPPVPVGKYWDSNIVGSEVAGGLDEEFTTSFKCRLDEDFVQVNNIRF